MLHQLAFQRPSRRRVSARRIFRQERFQARFLARFRARFQARFLAWSRFRACLSLGDGWSSTIFRQPCPRRSPAAASGRHPRKNSAPKNPTRKNSARKNPTRPTQTQIPPCLGLPYQRRPFCRSWELGTPRNNACRLSSTRTATGIVSTPQDVNKRDAQPPALLSPSARLARSVQLQPRHPSARARLNIERYFVTGRCKQASGGTGITPPSIQG